jgi:hypothetical protein
VGLLQKLRAWRQKNRDYDIERGFAGESGAPSPAMRKGADLGHGASTGIAGGYGERLPDDARGAGGDVET